MTTQMLVSFVRKPTAPPLRQPFSKSTINHEPPTLNRNNPFRIFSAAYCFSYETNHVVDGKLTFKNNADLQQ